MIDKGIKNVLAIRLDHRRTDRGRKRRFANKVAQVYTRIVFWQVLSAGSNAGILKSVRDRLTYNEGPNFFWH